MKKAIFYYSQTGNTKLLCQKIRREYPEFELVDMKEVKVQNLNDYKMVGFASFTWNLNVPPFFMKYIESLANVDKVPAFLVVTYSAMVGRSIKNAGMLLREKGFRVFEYHSIKMPDSFPPFRKKGILNESFPDENELRSFEGFLDRLDSYGSDSENKIKLGFWNTVIKPPALTKVMKDFGRLKVDMTKCSECNLCSENCDYNAIKCDPHPQFNMEICSACYNCFNNCPQGAIYTESVGSEFRYSGPDKSLKAKFDV